MRENKNWDKAVLAGFFLAAVLVIGVMSHPCKTAGQILTVFAEMAGSKKTEDVKQTVALDSAEKEYVDGLFAKDSLINLNGAAARLLNMKGFYSKDGIYITDDRYIVSRSAATSTDYEYEQIVNLKRFLDERGIHLLYVNAPTKYADDSFWEKEFGIPCYSNQNADLFLRRIKEAGIDCVDLRDRAKEDGKEISDMFYRTDHHWTTESGLWATGVLAETLNEKCGYHIDTGIYDNDNFIYQKYENAWLGEQGKKVAMSYVGLDDYTLIKPVFDTSFTLTAGGKTKEGTFDIMLDETRLSSGADVYDTPSWHYTYLPPSINQTSIHNNNVSGGNVLFLGDSYSQVVVPFLSLGVSDVSALVLRSYSGSLREFIDANAFDTVVVLYAQFMIGAHDDPHSANYDMFTFE